MIYLYIKLKKQNFILLEENLLDKTILNDFG